jgi:tetratricopeptide (TPR) repeat protein
VEHESGGRPQRENEKGDWMIKKFFVVTGMVLLLVTGMCAEALAQARAIPEQLATVLAMEDPTARIAALKKYLVAGTPEEQMQTAREATVASWAQLAEKQLGDNNIERAVADFRRAISDLPVSISDRFFVDTVIRVPQATSMRGYRLEAIELARMLEKRFPADATRLGAIGDYYMTIEAPIDAIRTLEIATRLKGEDAELHRRLAQAYRLGLRLDDAIYEYQYVIGLNQKDKRAFHELANLYRARGAYTDAITLYNAQLAVEPRHLPSYKGLALAWLAKGENARYEELLDKVRRLGESADDPAQDIYLQTQVALINLGRGRIALARRAAEAALAIEPRYAWARIAAAEVDLAEGKYFEAERNLLAARQYANFPTLAFTFGKLYLAVEDFDGALEQFGKVLQYSAEGQFQTRLGGSLGVEAESLRELLAPEHQAAIFLADSPTSAEIFQIAESLIRLDSTLAELKSNKTGQTGQPSQTGQEEIRLRRIDRQASLFLTAEPSRRSFRALYLSGRLAALNESAWKAIELTDEVFEKAEEMTAPEGSLRDYPNYDREGRLRIVRGRAWDLRGLAFYRTGRQKEAEKALLEAIREYGALPEARRALWNLGTVRETAGALSEALDLYLAAYEPPAPPTTSSSGQRVSSNDLKRTVIELLYRRVNGSLKGLDERLQRSADTVPTDLLTGLASIFGRREAPQMGPQIGQTDQMGQTDKTGKTGTPAAIQGRSGPPEQRAEKGRRTENVPASSAINGLTLTARIALPRNDPMFARPGDLPRPNGPETGRESGNPPANQLPRATSEPITDSANRTIAAPVARRPVILPAIPITIVITDPLSPFFNQYKYYSRWDSFKPTRMMEDPRPPSQPEPK